MYKDFFGKELAVGDKVIFIDSTYKNFKHGIITKLNPRQATVRDIEFQGKMGGRYDNQIGYGLTCRYYSNLIKEN